MVMTVKSWVDPNVVGRDQDRGTALADGGALRDRRLERALPWVSVGPSWVTVGMPGMLRVNVTAAPASGWPSGSVTVAEQGDRLGQLASA